MAYVYGQRPKKQQENSPGTKKRIYLARTSDFLALQVPVAAGAGDGDTVEIATAHTFAAPDGFVEIYATFDTGELTMDMAGERDSRIWNNKLVCQHPGLYKEMLEMANWVKDEDFIALVEMMDGSVVQLGADGTECDVTVQGSSGKNSGGYKGFTFTIENFGTPYLYTGVITKKP
jgi:hypothetical protein